MEMMEKTRTAMAMHLAELTGPGTLGLEPHMVTVGALVANRLSADDLDLGSVALAARRWEEAPSPPRPGARSGGGR